MGVPKRYYLMWFFHNGFVNNLILVSTTVLDNNHCGRWSITTVLGNDCSGSREITASLNKTVVEVINYNGFM